LTPAASLGRCGRPSPGWPTGVRGAEVLPGEAEAAGLPADRLAAAAAALADAARRRRALPVGETWTLEWRQPARPPRRERSRRR
jgi:hypothetical protein